MSQTYRILVTPEALGRDRQCVLDALGNNHILEFTGGQISDRQQLVERLQGKHAAILGVERIDGDVMDACPSVRLLSRFGTGYDSIDSAAAQARGIRVAVTPNLSSAAVAHHTMALILALLHNLRPSAVSLGAGQWQRRVNRTSADAVIGIAGFGSIGSEVANLACTLGFQVGYWARSEKPDVAAAGYQFHPTIDALIGACDVVSLHLKGAPELEGLIGASRLSAMSGKFLVNTARGSLVDEAALLNALDAGELEGAALDVFVREPVAELSARLAAHPKVVATPHVASFDSGTIRAMGGAAAMNIKHFVEGKLDLVRTFVA